MNTCTKEYTLTIDQAAINPDLYWTFDEAASPRVDKVHGVNLTVPVFWFDVDAAPALFSNGLIFDGIPAGAQITSAAVPYVTAGIGWSMWFWFRVNSWIVESPQIEIFTPLAPARMLANVQLNAPLQRVIVTVQDNNLVNFVPANFNPTLGTWYFLHVVFDPAVGLVGYQINNGPIVYDATPGAIFAAGGLNSTFFCRCSGPDAGQSIQIDECGIKLSANLTAADATYLYNGGAGRTWPL